MNPFHFRPVTPEADPDHDGEIVDWEDNWLSNALAWLSVTFTPTWCQHESDWTTRFTMWLWTSCPCCMFARGLVIGSILSSTLWLVIILGLTAGL